MVRIRKGSEEQSQEREAYEQLLKSCISIDSKQDEKKLSALTSDFARSSQDLQKKVAAFKEAITGTPLSAMVLLWGERVSSDKILGKIYLKIMRELVEIGLLPLTLNKKKTTTLQDLSSQDSSHIINGIRCHQNWSISRREDAVLLYTAFAKWLSQETCRYVPEAKDLDRIATQKRAIAFETYLKILSHLDLREQILAKMFYLGGQRALEEVLSVKIEDVDFFRSIVHFSEDVSYPCHLFEDIKRFIQGRKKGFVFAGKEEERVSTTTPFRALKKAAAKLGLDPEFTFKEFTMNI